MRNIYDQNKQIPFVFRCEVESSRLDVFLSTLFFK